MNGARKIAVMLVDDSAVVRALLKRIVIEQPDMEIVHMSNDGEAAVKDFETYRPDVVLMDIEMPKLDGITAVKSIIEIEPNARIVMCSSHTQTGSKKTFESLAAGALDFLSKPSSQSIDLGEEFKLELCNKIRTAHYAAPSHPRAIANNKAANTKKNKTNDDNKKDNTSTAKPTPIRQKEPIKLQKMPAALGSDFPSAIVFGASTGGPNALFNVLSGIDDSKLSAPIFITQHMPEGFTRGLVETLTQKTRLKIFEATDGMPVHNGCVYIAPGGKHLGLSKGDVTSIKLLDNAPVSFCKPSIDVMIREVSKTYESNMLIILLTGMGADGKESCHEIINAKKNNIIIAQDEASSVVWGIPGNVAKAGLCHAVLNLNDIANQINQLVQKRSAA